MELNRLLEITNDRERCEFCPDADNDETCLSCEKVNPITAEELREYHRKVRKALAENAKLKAELRSMQEEYLESCFGECSCCKFFVDLYVENSPLDESYCSIRKALEE